MWLVALATSLLAILAAIGAIRWLVIEFRTGVRSTQPLFGVNISLGETLTMLAILCAGVAWGSFRLSSQMLSRKRRSTMLAAKSAAPSSQAF
jgi:hypothetical protein